MVAEEDIASRAIRGKRVIPPSGDAAVSGGGDKGESAGRMRDKPGEPGIGDIIHPGGWGIGPCNDEFPGFDIEESIGTREGVSHKIFVGEHGK